MSPADGGITTGSVLVGKYRIEELLGRGGMALVYRAHHLQLDEPVAIKVLRDDAALDPDTVQRFVREAQAAVRLKSEHVARIQDVGTLASGLPYMVMELLEGADLGQLVEAHGAMVVPAAVDLMLQACDAIAEAHSLGIIHRDIKPTNLYVAFRPDTSPIVKVLDFGISKSAAQDQDMSLTQTSSILGTPAYMSPEQMRSARTVDARTDIWSLGSVLYELLEARRPFDAASFSEMCVMVASDPPRPLLLAPELTPIVMRCLAKNPEDRFPNVAALMHELAPFAGNTEAAHRYVRRAHRTLGLAVPDGRESQPSIVHASYELTPAAMPRMGMRGVTQGGPPDPASLVTTATTTPLPPARGSMVRTMLIATVIVCLGVGGTLAWLDGQAPTPASADAGTPSPGVAAAGPGSAGSSVAGNNSAGIAGSGSAGSGSTGSAAGGATVVGVAAGSAAGASAGSAAGASAGSDVVLTSTPPPGPGAPKPPRPRSGTTPPRTAESGTTATPTPPPRPPRVRCDPFASRTGCK